MPTKMVGLPGKMVMRSLSSVFSTDSALYLGTMTSVPVQ